MLVKTLVGFLTLPGLVACLAAPGEESAAEGLAYRIKNEDINRDGTTSG